jgi:hypothetical protein
MTDEEEFPRKRDLQSMARKTMLIMCVNSLGESASLVAESQ